MVSIKAFDTYLDIGPCPKEHRIFREALTQHKVHYQETWSLSGISLRSRLVGPTCYE